MEVISLCPFQLGALFWKTASGRDALTVVCKATFGLGSGEARLADVQEYPSEEDNHWNDDPARSLYSASDMVPFKRGADVTLVGEAFAPPGRPARNVVARLIVGSLDKSIEVWCDRFGTQHGELEEGARFTRMPLRYERAAGGPQTYNPVGIDREAPPDAYGRRLLPNLQPPGQSVGSPDDFIETVGFGPIAEGWPARVELLGAHARAWQPAWHEHPLPADLDARYFNCAPVDQRVEEIRPNERIVMEHLSPSEARLVTQLPGIEPRAYVERQGAVRELGLRGDTLWIDSSRALCTVTWRGQIELEHAAEQGRVLVAMQRPGELVGWPEVKRLADKMLGAERADARASEPPVTRAMDGAAPPSPPVPRTGQGIDDEHTAVGAQQRVPGALPFIKDVDETMPPAELGLAPPATRELRRQRGRTGTFATSGDDQSPAWLRRSGSHPGLDAGAAGPKDAAGTQRRPAGTAVPSSPWTRSPGPGASPAAERPPSSPALATPSVPGAGALGGSAAAAMVLGGGAALRSLDSPGAPVMPRAPIGPPPPAPAPAMPLAPFPGLEAKGPPAVRPPNPVAEAAAEAAAKRAEPPGAVADGRAAAGGEQGAKEPDAGTVRAREIVELVWYDPEAPRPVREHQAWAEVLDRLRAERRKSEPIDFDAQPEPEEPPEIKDRRDIVAVMTRARVVHGAALPRALLQAVDEGGSFEPPLVLVSGSLRLPFDELETLKATITFVTPVMAGNKKLQEAVETAKELMATPWLQGSGEVADGLTQRIREAFRQGNRMLSPGHLEEHTERMLLQQRNYQRRTVFGEERLRALMTPSGTDDAIPTYLPETLKKELPMFQSFPARLIAQGHVKQDQYETHDIALKVVALGRVISFTQEAQIH
ncbi:MAG: DUF2169 domain-containing protein [Deltaproteobacteria bacterium]|nr:DUF2169 domain-containing protein [Deltaproteobacteria bacterium]